MTQVPFRPDCFVCLLVLIAEQGEKELFKQFWLLVRSTGWSMSLVVRCGRISSLRS